MAINQTKKKRIGIFSALVIVLLIAGWIYVATAPVIEVESPSGDWRAVFFSDRGVITWSGELVYEGKESVQDISVDFFCDGETFPTKQQEKLAPFSTSVSMRVRLAMKVDEEAERYVSLMACSDKPKEVRLQVTWTQNGEVKTESLTYDAS